jgi:NADH dehydrogenase
MAFEVAERTTDPEEGRAAMTFVVVGGGPTGVEMAGAISEIARYTLVRDFRHIDSSQARVILLDAAPRVLPTFVPKLSDSALRQLRRIGVEVRLQTMVEQVGPEGVTLKGGETIAARTIVWAAGNAASPLGVSLGVPMDRQGRVIVREDLSIPGHPEVFVIGDMAHFSKEGGAPLPGVSPVAMQQGRHVARNIGKAMAGGWMEPFEYHDKGTMATIGRHAAVADLGRWKFGGFLAWLMWLFVHLIFLVSFRNKVTVLANWAYMYFTFGRGARLITGRQWPATMAPQWPAARSAGLAPAARSSDERLPLPPPPVPPRPPDKPAEHTR